MSERYDARLVDVERRLGGRLRRKAVRHREADGEVGGSRRVRSRVR